MRVTILHPRSPVLPPAPPVSGKGGGTKRHPAPNPAAAVPSLARLSETAGAAPVLPVTPGMESSPQRTKPLCLNALIRMRLHVNWREAAVQAASQRDNKKECKSRSYLQQ